MNRDKDDNIYFLLVDDLKENLIALEALLRRDALTILKASSGTEALELLLHYDVALAFIDVQMPDMDGFELAEFMRGMERTRAVPIIFLTAGIADKKRRFRGYEAGAVDFLQKPVEADVIRSKATVFYELYRRQKALERQRDELKIATEESRRYANALKEADRHKDEFLATLAHELRNPLAPLRNGLEILRLESRPPQRAETLAIMDRQLTLMVRLIDDLLDMSRVSKGKIELKRVPTTIQSIVESALESVKPFIDQRQHTLVIDMPETPIWVQADLTRMGQAVANLLNNAAKYTPVGGVITLRILPEEAQVRICIEDNGIGVPLDMQGRIFDLFTQVQSNGNSQQGLGIGLALVKHLVEMHGGRIDVESAGSDCGSAFTIVMPLVAAPAEESLAEVSPAPMSAAIHATASRHILIVDDNIQSAQTTGWMLELLGHRCVLAHNGSDALAQAEALRPDVILLDIGLPDLNGYEICRRLRAQQHFAHTQIIAQTGWGQQRDRDLAHQAGFDHHLVKPLRLEQIAALLRMPDDGTEDVDTDR